MLGEMQRLKRHEKQWRWRRLDERLKKQKRLRKRLRKARRLRCQQLGGSSWSCCPIAKSLHVSLGKKRLGGHWRPVREQC